MENAALIGWGRGKALFVASLGKSILLLTAASGASCKEYVNLPMDFRH